MAAPNRAIKRPPTMVNVPTSNTNWINPADNPEEANQTIEKLLAETNSSPMPEIPFPDTDIVVLPGGLARKDTIIQSVEVRELTGEDEESLAKASQSSSIFSFLDRLLRCGVSRIGNESVTEKDKLLSQMLIGDREAIILGIRQATYGNKIEIEDWNCSHCNFSSELSLELSDIPSSKLSDLDEATFKVPLRKGGYALVRLANGDDQLAVFEKADLTQAQRETILISRCVISLTDTSGKEKLMAAFPSMSRSLSIPDRHSILRELNIRQPGPKYDQVKFDCESCGTEQTVTVTIGHLFLDFGWV